MNTLDALEKIYKLLLKPEEGFDVIKNKKLSSKNVILYAKRNFGFSGKDFLFVFNLDDVNNDILFLRQIHEEVR
ncbi:MAG: hypothetical protein JXA68_07490 [Ignavibacteriales bacterium]|nr:hypothetical protein [Ignavibacteriales bacterium]